MTICTYHLISAWVTIVKPLMQILGTFNLPVLRDELQVYKHSVAPHIGLHDLVRTQLLIVEKLRSPHSRFDVEKYLPAFKFHQLPLLW